MARRQRQRFIKFLRDFIPYRGVPAAARQAGIDYQHIQNWLEGSEPNPRELAIFAEAHGLDPIYLFWLNGYLPDRYRDEAAVLQAAAAAKSLEMKG